MSYYIATAKRPLAVVDSVAGNFISPTELHLVIAHTNHVTINLIKPDGLCPLKEFTVHGRIIIMRKYRLKDSNKDLIFIVTRSFKAMLLEVSMDVHDICVETKSHSDVSDFVGILSEGGFLCTIDSNARAIGLSLYQGIFTLLSLNENATVQRKTSLRLDHLMVYDIEFLHGAPNPTLIVLHKDYDGHHVKTYEINIYNEEFEDLAWSKENVEDVTTMLIAIPSPIGGALIVGSKSIIYHNGSHSVVQFLLSQSCVKCFSPVDDNGLVYLLGCSGGQLYRVSLKTEETETGIDVKNIKVEQMGEFVSPQSVSYLGNDLAFIGNCDGASQLVHLEPNPLVLKTYSSLAPIRDMISIGTFGQGQCQIVTCSGTGKEGSLHNVFNGMGIKHHDCIDLPGVTGVWSLKAGIEGSPYENILALTVIGHTRFLALSGEDVEETDIPGFASDQESLMCFNIDDQLIQVTIESVRLVKSDAKTLVGEWKPDGNRSIDVVSCNATQIVIASMNEIFYICIEDGMLVEKGRTILPNQVACLDVTPLDEQENKSDLIAVGLWTEMSAVILSLPDLNIICTEKLGEIIPRSILMTKYEDTSYLLCGLGDGSLLYFIMDTTGQLKDKMKIILSTQPLTLFKHRSNVFAYVNQPILLKFSKDGQHSLSVIEVNLMDVVHMCSLNAEAYPDSLAVATARSIVIVQVFESSKATYPLGEEPRSITHQEMTETFGVATMHRAVCSFNEIEWIKKKLLPQPIKEKIMVKPIEDGPGTSKASIACIPSISSIRKPIRAMSFEMPTPKKLIATVFKETEVHKLVVINQHTFDIIDAYEFLPPEKITSLVSIKFDNDPKSYYVVGTEQRLLDGDTKHSNYIIVFCYDIYLKKLIKVTEMQITVICYTLIELKGKLLAGMDGIVCLYEWTADQELHLLYRFQHMIAIKHLRAKDDIILAGDWLGSASLLQYKEMDPFLEEIARDEYHKWTSSIEILSDNAYLITDNQENLYVLECSSKEEPYQKDSIHLFEIANYKLRDKINIICQGSLISENVRQRIAPIKGGVLYGTNNGGIGIIAEVHKDYGKFLSSLQEKLKNVVKLLGGCQYEHNEEFIDGDLIEKFLELDRFKMHEVVADLEISDVDEVIGIVETLKALHTNKLPATLLNVD